MNLMRALARHCRDRYGLREVSRWYWELWNEPDISYWAGTPEAFYRLFDYTEWGIHSVLPQAKLGGPATTSPGHDNAERFLQGFLTHCTEGENEITGQRGTRLDFISFHTKGGGYGREPDAPKKTPTLATLFGHIDAGLEIVREFPELRQHEIILSECDPDGWAAGTTADNPNLSYRNTEYYASYVAAAACHLASAYADGGSRVDGMLTWAFQFEGRDTFAGSRALSTNGIDKPVLNVFRLLGRLGRAKLSLAVEPAPNLSTTMNADALPALTGIAAGDAMNWVQLLLVAHHDDWDVESEVDVEIEVTGLPDATYSVVRWDLDRDHANAHTAWVEMGRPRSPDPAQTRALQAAAALHPEPMALAETQEGTLTLAVRLRAHSALLLELHPRDEPEHS
jgi:xylan 1,4-beta-xylosidase